MEKVLDSIYMMSDSSDDIPSLSSWCKSKIIRMQDDSYEKLKEWDLDISGSPFIRRCDWCMRWRSIIFPNEYVRDDMDYQALYIFVCDECINTNTCAVHCPYERCEYFKIDNILDDYRFSPEHYNECNICSWIYDEKINFSFIYRKDKLPYYGSADLFLWRLFGGN